jgi:preprotein translocase subunit SecE
VIFLPTNKKEGIIFTTLMCFLMVLGMSVYNLWLHDSLQLTALFTGLIPGFIVAFILDVFVVGVVAKKIAFKLPVNKEKKWQMILTISCLMVLGMVTFMSLFGIIIEQGTSDILAHYPTTWRMNLIAALPLQLLIVGPISRKILQMIQAQPAQTAGESE